jgi:hypothetical protein
MRQLKQQRPSPRQINALLSLYRIYKSRFSACGEHAERAERPLCSSGPFSRKRDAVHAQLTLPLFNQDDSARAQRLAWASGIIGREVSSFTELLPEEAATLIDTLKRSLGQKVNPPSRRRPDRDQAQAYGTAGRRDQDAKEIQLVDEPTLDLIAGLVVELGWSVERFNSFLVSHTSPVRSGAVRTLAEANRVIWALKDMLRKREGNFYRKGTR